MCLDSGRDADLFGVELHLVLSLWEKLNVICSVDLLGNYSDLISNRELKRDYTYMLHKCVVCSETFPVTAM